MEALLQKEFITWTRLASFHMECLQYHKNPRIPPVITLTNVEALVEIDMFHLECVQYHQKMLMQALEREGYFRDRIQTEQEAAMHTHLESTSANMHARAMEQKIKDRQDMH